MDSKKRYSYQWRLFIPVVLSMWAIVGAMAWWNVYRVHQERRNLLYDQLDVVTARIVELFHQGSDTDAFLDFTNRYYREKQDYDEATMNVYDVASGRIIDSHGPNVLVAMPSTSLDHGIVRYNGMRYIYSGQDTMDGKNRIVTMLPITKKISVSVSDATQRFWLLVIMLGIFATIIAYITTRYLSQNVRLLRNFANRTSTDPNFVPNDIDSFPNDELGDISREIMLIYRRLLGEMKAREREHEVAIAAIEDKARIKRELVSNINHEIKTPVGIIKGYVDTIVGDPNMDPATHWRFLNKIKDNVDRLTNLIADISMITKFENNGQLVNITEVDFHDLVFTFADEVKIVFPPEKSLKFTHNVPLNCRVRGNESLLVSLLNNLVRNAQLYSKGTFCRLEFEREDADFYYFTFYDDGVGVPPEALPNMFERFFRVNSGRARNAGGTGLGLPIVKVTIESFGGTIDVNNRTPSGLIYHFTLPKYKPGNRSNRA